MMDSTNDSCTVVAAVFLFFILMLFFLFASIPNMLLKQYPQRCAFQRRVSIISLLKRDERKTEKLRLGFNGAIGEVIIIT